MQIRKALARGADRGESKRPALAINVDYEYQFTMHVSISRSNGSAALALGRVGMGQDHSRP